MRFSATAACVRAFRPAGAILFAAAGLATAMAWPSLAEGQAQAPTHSVSRGVSAASQATAGEQVEESQADAQSSADRLAVDEQIVVTAERLTVTLPEIGSSVSVIDREQIRASGARWLHQVLNWVPGLAVVPTGGPGSVTSVFSRGTNSNHLLVLLDGVKLNLATTGAYDFAHLPAARVERLEIVRGPQGVLYGSEAIGGVVNIVTRRPGAGLGEPAEMLIEIDVEGGGAGVGRGGVTLSGTSAQVDYSAGFSYLDSSGDSATLDPPDGESDGYRNVAFDARLGHRSNAGWQVEAFVRGFDARADLDGFVFGVGPVDDDNFVQMTRELYVGGRAGYRGDGWSSWLTLSRTQQDLDLDDPDGAFFTGGTTDASIAEVDWQNEIELGARHRLMGGLEYRREAANVLSRSPFGNTSVDESIESVGVFATDHLRVGDSMAFSVGARYENHSTFGDHLGLRVTASARATDVLRLHGSLGGAFRAPSLTDLFFPGFGNPALDAERSTGYDAGAELYLRDAGLLADATYYHNDIDDLIQFSFATFVAENIGQASTEGVEVTLQWAPSGSGASRALRIDGSYTFTRAEEVGGRGQEVVGGAQLLRRPRHVASLRATLGPRDGWLVFGEMLAKGARADAGPTGRVTLDAFTTFTLAVSRELAAGVELFTRLENVGAAHVEEVFGFRSPGRQLFVGLRLGAR